jgi:hypothetical protein
MMLVLRNPSCQKWPPASSAFAPSSEKNTPEVVVLQEAQFNESTRTKFDGSHSDGFSSTTLARLRRSYLAMIAPLDHKPVADYRRPHRKKVS